MAQGKKSFVLYADLVHVVRKLPKDTRGDLFLVILEYVNDNLDIVQVMEEIDILLSVTFEPIKQQLKRDLRKYSEKLDERSNSGIIGNLKRWNNDLYVKYDKGELSLQDALVIVSERNNRKASLSDKTNRKASLSIANVADNDNVNDNVNVNDSVDNKLSAEYSPQFICEVEKIQDFMLSGENAYWFETYCMQNRASPDTVKQSISEFVAELKNQNIKEKSRRDVFSHFHHWYKKNKTNATNQSVQEKRTVFQA